jgi:predicted aspartyl protease
MLEQGMAWVNASVQGRPLRLLVDLGGFDTVALVPEELKEIPLTWTGRERTTFSAMGETAKAREYELKEFELGGVRFPEIRGFEDLLRNPGRRGAPATWASGF